MKSVSNAPPHTHKRLGVCPKRTPSSGEPCICSAKPIKSMSGRWVTHSALSCSSAWERTVLSVDCRPCSSWASAACTEGGRCDMVGGRVSIDCGEGFLGSERRDSFFFAGDHTTAGASARNRLWAVGG